MFAGLGADYLQGSDFGGASPGDDSDLLLADFSVFDYDIDFDKAVAVHFPLDRGFLFDAHSGVRLVARLVSVS